MGAACFLLVSGFLSLQLPPSGEFDISNLSTTYKGKLVGLLVTHGPYLYTEYQLPLLLCSALV